jgi:hypothetical protein
MRLSGSDIGFPENAESPSSSVEIIMYEKVPVCVTLRQEIMKYGERRIFPVT